MRAWILLTILFFVLASGVVADEFIFDDTLYQARDIELDIEVSGVVDWSGSASSVQAQLFYYPKDFDGQTITQQATTPQTPIGDESITFRWQEPQRPVSFSHQSIVESSYSRPRIQEPIPFPIQSVPSSMDEYLRSEEIIVITDDIRELADEIVGDEDDAVRVAYLLGSWVKDNIRYDLNTVTADASQTSQWVLDNGEGVCDELTSLFISMLRSQGIPARFVSGVAYTNLEELDSPWGPHGWAEVYLPEVGWVPYDVTYGQFGWVDATHVGFVKSADALSSAAEYSMRGREAQLRPNSLQRDVELVSRSGGVPLYVRYEIEPALEQVGPGGFNRIDVTLINDMPFYVSTELFLARTSKLSTNDYSRSILLGPREERTVSWTVEVADDLEEGFEYTFPLVIYTNDNQQWRSEFTASTSAYESSREEVEVVSERTRTPSSFLSCNAPRSVRVGEEVRIECSANATICIDEQCADNNLVLERSFSEVGVYNVVAKAGDQRRVLTISAEDEPSYELLISAPETIAFPNSAVINVTARKTSTSAPRDVAVSLGYVLHEQRWEVPVLSEEVTFQLEVRADQLTAGENVFVARSGEQEVRASIRAAPRGFMDRLSLWINSMVGVIARLF